MSKKKIEKVYYFEFFIDEYENKYLIDKRWCEGSFVFRGKCWKDCLVKFLSEIYKRMVSEGNENKFLHSMIGLKHYSIKCEFKPVDFNYINRLIVSDDSLSMYFYC